MEIELISERVAEAIMEERFLNKESIQSRIAPIIKIWSNTVEKKYAKKHKEKGDFIERQVLKLQRKYSKDELVAHLSKTIKEKDFKIGELTSEIDELKFKIKNSYRKSVNKSTIEANKELRKDKLNIDRIDKIKKLEKEVDKYRKANNVLLSRIVQT